MKLNKKVYRWVLEISIIIIVLLAVRFWMQRDVVSGIAPNISAATLKGQHFDLYKDQRRPMLVHFWATWCPVCKLEQSNIENTAKDHPVMTIAMQSGNNDELSQFMQAEKLSFTVINDESGMLSRSYNIRGVPVSFIIDKENKIEFVEVGYTTELGLRVRLWWAGL
ncbi:MAG: protein disulfide oxidoreductase [Gammaproteobacteria bacterium]|nr:protein disulfide oxidoreductase [Gammaproteobacteria bacterium]